MGCNPSHPNLNLKVHSKRALQHMTTTPLTQKSRKKSDKLDKNPTKESSSSSNPFFTANFNANTNLNKTNNNSNAKMITNSQELGLDSMITIGHGGGRRRVTRRQMLEELCESEEFFREIAISRV